MKRLLRPWLSILLITMSLAAEPVPLIFDTDMGNDIDDALALAVIHALESRGECRLLGVTVTKDNRFAAPFVNLVNNFYGRGEIAVGAVRNGKTTGDGNYVRPVVESNLPDGSPTYPRTLADGGETTEAVTLLRRLLSNEEDESVVVVQVGFSTNLARLLDSPADEASPLPGRELAARKVRLLSLMGGAFPPTLAEYNIRVDLSASTKLFAEWPTPIVVSGFEIGKSILYPAESIEKDFQWVKRHPVVDAYRAYKPMPYDRPTWDLTSVLYAVRPGRGYFGLSPTGTIRVDEEGFTRFTPSKDGQHRYLTVDDSQRVRVLEALIQLASQPTEERAAEEQN